MGKKPSVMRRFPHDENDIAEATFWDYQQEIKTLQWTELGEEDQHEYRDELNSGGGKLRNHLARLERLRQYKIRRAFLMAAAAIHTSPDLLNWISGNEEIRYLLEDILLGAPRQASPEAQLYGEHVAEQQLMSAIEALESQPELLKFVDDHGLKGRILLAFEAMDETEHPASMESEMRRKRAYERAAKHTIEALHQREAWEYLNDNEVIEKLEKALKGPSSKIDGIYDRPSVVVVDRIGDAESSEGKQVANQYGHLMKPVPLAALNVDIDAFRMALELEFPAFLGVIEQVCAELRLRKNAGADSIRFRPMLLVGPPGVGKTRFAQKLAKLLGTGYGAISAAGADDARVLMGTSRGWGNKLPSFPILTITRTGFANPVIVVDEIDKGAARTSHGKLVDVLLPFLETQSAKEHPDDCLLGKCDLSYVSWILTANDLSKIPETLLSRCSIFVVTQAAHDPERLLNQIRTDLAEELGVQVGYLPELDPQVRTAMKDALAQGMSIRRVKKLLLQFLGEEDHSPPLLN